MTTFVGAFLIGILIYLVGLGIFALIKKIRRKMKQKVQINDNQNEDINDDKKDD